MKKIALLILLVSCGLSAQEQELSSNTDIFFFDSIVFDSDSSGKARMDVFTVIPYQSLTFIRSGEVFGAEYEITYKISNTDGNNNESRTIRRTVTEPNYFSTQGGNGEFEYNQSVFFLPEGRYNVDVIYFDKTGNRSFKRNRIQTILDFDRFNFSISGLLLVSSIEEIEGKYKITPHISDNIGNLSEFFFLFFETYRKNANLDEADFIYRFDDKNNETVFQSQRIRMKIDSGTGRKYIRVNIPSVLNQGTYMLRLFCLAKSEETGFGTSDIIASSERSVKYFKTFGGAIIDNLDKSIRQLRYIASQSEINYIESASNEQEKAIRFEEFWKKHDPSPNTERNEAYDDYFARISYANTNFRTYAEGWLTDMGQVYIVYGTPVSIERSNRAVDGKIYERWIYSGRQFVFVDYNGIGDYRLYQPITVNDKYRYQ